MGPSDPYAAALPELPSYDDINPPPGDEGDYYADGGMPPVEAAANDTEPLPVIDPSIWHEMPIPPREWMVADWLPLRQATYLTGPGSAGKSLLSQQLATCISLGLPFLGQRTREAPAFYITCEDDADELHRRQAAICKSLNITLSALKGRLHLTSLMGATDNYLATFDQDGHMRIEPRYRQIEAAILQHPGAFVVMDNVAHLTGDEIRRSAVAGFVNLMNRLALNSDGAVLFLGHPNKAGDAYSGSTAWENQVRARLFMETPKDEHGEAPDPDVRTLSRAKSNYSRNGEALEFRWREWAFVRDEDLPKGMGANLAETAQVANDNATFLRCLAERNKQRRPVSERFGPNYAPAQFERMREAKGVSKKRLEAAMERLFEIGKIKRDFIMRDTEKGRDVHGIVAVDNHPQTLPQTHPKHDPQTPPKPAPKPVPQTPLGTTYHRGGPLGDGPPPVESEDGDGLEF